MNIVETPIDRVTVYRNGALVVRKGEGHGPVEVLGLPLLFASDSLRVRPHKGVVVDLEETVRLRTTPAPPPADERARIDVALRLAALDDELRSVEALLSSLEALTPEVPDVRRAPDTLDASAYVGLLHFARERAEPLFQRRQELREQRRKLEEEARELAARATPEPKPPVVTRGCKFTLDEACAFELEYFVAAARWVPSYTLHLDSGVHAPGGTPARSRLSCGALIAQATGEPWSGALVSVSTADLLRETNLPPLSSWRIGRAQTQKKKAWRPLPSDLPTLFSGYDSGPRAVRGPSGAAPPAAPEPAPPPAQAAPYPGDFERASSAELRSFEKDRTGARPARAEMLEEPEADMLSDDGDFDEATGEELAVGGRMYDEGAASMVNAADMPEEKKMARRPMPPPSAAPITAMPAGMVMPSRARMSFGGGGRAQAEEAAVARVKDELPARWRAAYLRMAGPDEHLRRGQLVPLAPLDRLEWMLDAHDVDAEGKAQLGRALRALLDAQKRLEQTPLPQGTMALLGTHFFALLSAQERTDVPTDGTFYRVEVRRDEGPAVLEHRAVPRESTDVWRFCKLELKGAPLPAGPLAVYEDGAFKVRTRLDPSATTSTLDINLGVDPDVRVVGRTAHTDQQEKGLVSQTSRVTHKIKVELRSARKEPATVVVYDRLPVPADNVKDVTVSVVEEKPPMKRTNKDPAGLEVPGAVEWRTTMMPGDLFVVSYSYAIDLPAKAELEGGNRRE